MIRIYMQIEKRMSLHDMSEILLISFQARFSRSSKANPASLSQFASVAGAMSPADMLK